MNSPIFGPIMCHIVSIPLMIGIIISFIKILLSDKLSELGQI